MALANMEHAQNKKSCYPNWNPYEKPITPGCISLVFFCNYVLSNLEEKKNGLLLLMGRHNERDYVSYRRHIDCLLSCSGADHNLL